MRQKQDDNRKLEFFGKYIPMTLSPTAYSRQNEKISKYLTPWQQTGVKSETITNSVLLTPVFGHGKYHHLTLGPTAY